MKKTTEKKLTLKKIKIARLSAVNGREFLTTTSDLPTNAVTCAVCDPVTFTQVG